MLRGAAQNVGAIVHDDCARCYGRAAWERHQPMSELGWDNVLLAIAQLSPENICRRSNRTSDAVRASSVCVVRHLAGALRTPPDRTTFLSPYPLINSRPAPRCCRRRSTFGRQWRGLTVRVLMLGWEFPPYISGGLGTACFGLTKALSRTGTDIVFVLPRAGGSEHASDVRLLTASARGIQWQPER